MIAASFKRSVNNHSIRFASRRSTGLNRVFAAAVVNRQFCDMLLKDPQAALQNGYLGEVFTLTPEEKVLIASIRANTLSDLAKQLYGPSIGND